MEGDCEGGNGKLDYEALYCVEAILHNTSTKLDVEDVLKRLEAALGRNVGQYTEGVRSLISQREDKPVLAVAPFDRSSSGEASDSLLASALCAICRETPLVGSSVLFHCECSVGCCRM
jgi:hypothetical protein